MNRPSCGSREGAKGMQAEQESAGGARGAELALAAAALDAEGRHDDAVNLLARAARGGDAAAKRLVGARILIGDRAPALPVQGVGLILEAAHQGDPEAAALSAVLAAAGAFRTQSWRDALDWLARAADLGSEAAQGQLRALAGGADAAVGGSASSWRSVRSRIDVAALLSAPEGQDLSADPLVRRIPRFAEAAVCDWLIERARGGLRRAQVYDDSAQADAVSETRTNSIRIFSLLETDVVQIVLQHRMAAASGLPFAHMEAMAVLHYAEGEQITEHYDFIDPRTADYERQVARDGQRAVTFLVYLNEDHEDGETAFPRLGVSHKGVRGEALFFRNVDAADAADVRTLHAGRPPRGGEKWVVSQFIRSRPFAPGAAS